MAARAQFWMPFVFTLIHRFSRHCHYQQVGTLDLASYLTCIIDTKKTWENGKRYDHSCQAPRRVEYFRPAQRGCIGPTNLCAKHARSQVPAAIKEQRPFTGLSLRHHVVLQ